MFESKFWFVILTVTIMLLPITIMTKKFTAISAPDRFSVTVNPLSCYKCKVCPCEYTLRDNKKYILNRVDKTKCILNSNLIVDAIENKDYELTFDLKIPEYINFYDCLTWYSVHPTELEYSNRYYENY